MFPYQRFFLPTWLISWVPLIRMGIVWEIPGLSCAILIMRRGRTIGICVMVASPKQIRQFISEWIVSLHFAQQMMQISLSSKLLRKGGSLWLQPSGQLGTAFHVVILSLMYRAFAAFLKTFKKTVTKRKSSTLDETVTIAETITIHLCAGSFSNACSALLHLFTECNVDKAARFYTQKPMWRDILEDMPWEVQ